MSAAPTLWLIAGPNGVGKTSYAFRMLRQVSGSVHFVNLDEIARGLSPLEPALAQRAAARVALDRMREFLERRGGNGSASFSVETTLAGRTHLRTLADARAAGFRTAILYFSVSDVRTCLARIARRVAEGGHDVPETDVRRRFERSAGLFRAYADAVDLWRAFDANGPAPKVVAEGRRGCRSMASDLTGLPPVLAAHVRAMPPCDET